MKKSPSGFTLVELLVVIVIIAIMAGIALPVFARVQETARATQDASNLRQIGIAVQTYRVDNDGNLLDSTKSPVAAMYPTYISALKVFKSPFDKNITSDNIATAQMSYVINGVPSTTGVPTGSPIIGLDASKIAYPSSYQLFMPNVDQAIDSSSGEPKFPQLLSTATQANYSSKSSYAATGKGTHRSRQFINVLFADGHTEAVTYAKFANTAAPSAANGQDDGAKRWKWDAP